MSARDGVATQRVSVAERVAECLREYADDNDHNFGPRIASAYLLGALRWHLENPDEPITEEQRADLLAAMDQLS